MFVLGLSYITCSLVVFFRDLGQMIAIALQVGIWARPILWNLHLPLMTGYLKQAYITAVGMGLKMVVSTEYLVQTKNSLGKAINTSIYFNEYEEIYAYALIMILLVVLISELPLLFVKGESKN